MPRKARMIRVCRCLALPGRSPSISSLGPKSPSSGQVARFLGMSTFMASARTAAAETSAGTSDRRRRPGARPRGDQGGASAPGQAQADLHAVHRHRRSRRRRQRGEGEAHRPQGRSEDLPAAQRLRRRPARRARASRAPAQARTGSSRTPCTACCPRRSSAKRCIAS